MRNVWAIFQKEMRSYFVSPVAYVVLAIFLLICGYFFYGLLVQFLDYSMRSTLQAQYYRVSPPKVNVNELVIRPLFLNMTVIALFILPALTMRLYAEEKKMGTLELLLTSPLTPFQTVLGKFLAGLALYAILIASTGILLAVLFLFAEGAGPEWGPIWSGYLGTFLFGASFIALGLLISTFTENQIVAATGTFGLFLLLWVIDWLASYAGPTLGGVITYLSVISHFEDLAKGIIDSKDLVFYGSVTGLGLFLTYRSLESLRWRG